MKRINIKNRLLLLLMPWFSCGLLICGCDGHNTSKAQQSAPLASSPVPKSALQTATTSLPAHSLSTDTLNANGIGDFPVIDYELASSTVDQSIKDCNNAGKVWAPTSSTGMITAGACAENLAPFVCTTDNVEQYFTALDLVTQYQAMTDNVAGYSLYNCGLNNGILYLHWIQGSASSVLYYLAQINYESLTP